MERNNHKIATSTSHDNVGWPFEKSGKRNIYENNPSRLQHKKRSTTDSSPSEDFTPGSQHEYIYLAQEDPRLHCATGRERLKDYTQDEEVYRVRSKLSSHNFLEEGIESSISFWNSSLASLTSCNINSFLNLHRPSNAEHTGPESQGLDWVIRLFPELVPEPGKIF